MTEFHEKCSNIAPAIAMCVYHFKMVPTASCHFSERPMYLTLNLAFRKNILPSLTQCQNYWTNIAANFQFSKLPLRPWISANNLSDPFVHTAGGSSFTDNI